MAFACSIITMAATSGYSTVHKIARLSAIAMAVFPKVPNVRWKLAAYLLIFATTVFAAVAWGPQDFLTRRVSKEPAVHIAAPDARVQVGGECVSLLVEPGRGFTVTVCFYYRGLAVLAAHPMPVSDARQTLSPGPLPPGMLAGEVVLEGSTPYGLIVSGLVPPEQGREFLPVGGTDEVKVGEEATLLSGWKGPHRVRILGYAMRGKEQFLAIEFVEPDQVFEGGMSGSPIVQDDRVVGFAAATLMTVSWKSPQIALARVAGEVFDGVRSILERSGVR